MRLPQAYRVRKTASGVRIVQSAVLSRRTSLCQAHPYYSLGGLSASNACPFDPDQIVGVINVEGPRQIEIYPSSHSSDTHSPPPEA